LYAGISVPNFSTSSEAKRLLATGRFTEMQGERYTDEPNYLKRGDILVKQGHTAVVLNDGDKAEKPDPTEQEQGEQNTPAAQTEVIKLIKVKGSVKVRTGNGTFSKRIGTAKNCELPYLGQAQTYPNWYMTQFNGQDGYISSNPKYTELITKEV
jgi:hypothetical protein